MPGLCGWFAADPARESQAILTAMSAGLPGGGHGRTLCQLGEDAAAAVASRLSGSLAMGAEGAIVAVDGHPRFASSALESEADAHGPAQAILAAYAARGEAVLEDVRGPFALAILDPLRDRALLAVDRMGIHALFYARTRQGLVFGTTADAMRAHPDVSTTVSPQAVYRYAVNYVSPAPFTIYDECRKLLPAHLLEWRAGHCETRRYWRIPYGRADGEAGRSLHELREELFERLDISVRRALARNGEAASVGTFLSGGLDSSAVSGILHQNTTRKVPAFTIGFADSKYDETAFAQAAVRRFGLEHHTYRLTPQDAAELVPRLAEAFDEPFGNSSVIPAFYCAQLARSQGVNLLLAGDGGDEIFGGNKRYAEQKILALYHRVPAPFRAVLASVLLNVPEPLAVSALGKGQRYVRRARLPMPERMLSKQVYTDDALPGIFTSDALAAIEPEEPVAIWRRHYEEAGTDDLIYAMLHLDTRIALADNDLRKVGRAAEMAGVEVAYPMLDEDLVEFAARIPSALLVKGFDLRHFFKEAMRGFLPDEILNKKKHGFGMPFAEWTRNDPILWNMVVDAFSNLKTRNVFRGDFLDAVLDAHRDSADSPLSGIVWDLLMLELWWQKREG